MEPNTSAKMRKFSGQNMDWPQFLADLIEFLRNMTDLFRFGATGFVLTEPMYNAQHNQGEAPQAFVDPADPGGPPADFAPDATAAVIARWTVLNNINIRANDHFREVRKLKLSLKKMLLEITPDDDLDQMRDPVDGFLRTTPAAWFIVMLRIHGRLSAADLEANLELLEAPWDPSSPFPSHVAQHRRVHLIQLTNGQGLRMMDKVKLLKKSVHHVGFLNGRIDSYTIARPNPEDQLFDGEHGLATALLEFERNCSRTISTKVAGFVNSAISSTPAEAFLLAEVTQLRAQLAASVSQLSTTKPAGGHKKQRGAGAVGAKPSVTPIPLFYCWSHGLCGHPGIGPPPPLGIGCANRRPGHDESANWLNKKGGSTKC